VIHESCSADAGIGNAFRHEGLLLVEIVSALFVGGQCPRCNPVEKRAPR
jgi:hypothetical protein